MASRVLAAASETGIGMTLLPVFYAHGDFGGAPPTPGQRRFICRTSTALRGCSRRAASLVAKLEGANIGVAPHSLRAVAPDELAAILALSPDGPVHIHAAEQVREVEACLAWSGQRPVEWLLEHAAVDPRWCLIHATHMTEAETEALAACGATAGLCPITEANLGDGIFNGRAVPGGGRAFRDRQRFERPGRCRRRASPARIRAAASRPRAEPHGRRRQVDRAHAVREGRRGRSPGARPRPTADLRRARQPTSSRCARTTSCSKAAEGDRILDAWIFAAKRTPSIDSVWVRGVKQVVDGRHRRREGSPKRRFRRCRCAA